MRPNFNFCSFFSVPSKSDRSDSDYLAGIEIWRTYISKIFPLCWFFNCFCRHNVWLIIWISQVPILHTPPHWKTISVISISDQLITKNYQLSRPITLVYGDVKVSHKDKRAWFGFLSSFTSFWSVGKMYIEKWEPLYSGHLVLINIFLRNHHCRL